MKFAKNYQPTKVRAYFDSECPECGDVIEEGDPIAFLESDKEWLHYECATEVMSMEGDN